MIKIQICKSLFDIECLTNIKLIHILLLIPKTIHSYTVT